MLTSSFCNAFVISSSWVNSSHNLSTLRVSRAFSIIESKSSQFSCVEFPWCVCNALAFVQSMTNESHYCTWRRGECAYATLHSRIWVSLLKNSSRNAFSYTTRHCGFHPTMSNQLEFPIDVEMCGYYLPERRGIFSALQVVIYLSQKECVAPCRYYPFLSNNFSSRMQWK